MRAYEKRYKISEGDDVLAKLNAILRDLDQRTDAVELVKEAFEQGNRLDVDALLNKITSDIAIKSEAMQELIDETEDGFTPDRILETPLKRFTSDAEQQAHVDGLAEANSRINTRATSAALGAHTARLDNPHAVTAEQVGTLTEAEIDAALDFLEAHILGTASAGADTLGKLEALIGKRVRADAANGFSLAERGQARANIGAGVLAGFRNKIVNGNFDIWQRGPSQTMSGYGSDDRWRNFHSGSTKTSSRQAFAMGQTDVPGSPAYFSRTIVASVAGAGNYVIKEQRIEKVSVLAGKRATLTFYAKADVPRSIAAELVQQFGAGGAPSAFVPGIGAVKLALTAAWQRFTVVVDIPSIAGKTLGTDGNDCLSVFFWLDAGASFNARTGNLGQQSGTFDIARVSIVEGDASTEDDPFEPRHPAQELALCQRYYEKSYELETVPGTASVAAGSISMRAAGSGSILHTLRFLTRKRTTPTITSFSGSTGATGMVRNNSTDIAAAPTSVSTTGYRETSLASAAGDNMIWHYSADAEL
nr:hypothetical protein [uncultured Shinella sp.]